ncbi:hypothetical protein AAFF_G00055690 [Aldrovandia affinis]|uniref:Uncharacterized protein n=1 Tax=Aldrovandia affinis TaxID=143900 RepID=A0AAD7WEN7_9TELE|nr:hypothetical protein AAFF_G00055690 [Aldrovandia affinis]
MHQNTRLGGQITKGVEQPPFGCVALRRCVFEGRSDRAAGPISLPGRRRALSEAGRWAGGTGALLLPLPLPQSSFSGTRDNISIDCPFQAGAPCKLIEKNPEQWRSVTETR